MPSCRQVGCHARPARQPRNAAHCNAGRAMQACAQQLHAPRPGDAASPAPPLPSQVADFATLVGTYSRGFAIIIEPFDDRLPSVRLLLVMRWVLRKEKKAVARQQRMGRSRLMGASTRPCGGCVLAGAGSELDSWLW